MGWERPFARARTLLALEPGHRKIVIVLADRTERPFTPLAAQPIAVALLVLLRAHACSFVEAAVDRLL